MVEANSGKEAERYETTIIEPSADVAWLLGAVVGGGSVRSNQSTHVISATDANEQVLQKFRTVGERVIGVPSRDSRNRSGSNTTVSFFNKRYAKALGDLRRETWPE